MKTITFFALCLCLTSPSFAQTVGDKVFTIKEAELKSGSEVVRKAVYGKLLEIERVNGEWFWVNYDGTKGWINKKDVALPDQAIEALTRKIRANPNDVEAYRIRSIAWYHKGALDSAIADMTEAIRINPKSAAYYKDRGIAWCEKGENDKALADFDEAIRLNPKFALAYMGRGNAWQKKGEYDKGIADYDEAIRIDPKEMMVYHNRAMAWKTKGEYDKAIADYDEAIRLESTSQNSAKTYNGRGDVWSIKQEYGKAIADFTEVIRLDPNHVHAYGKRAWLYATCPDARYRNGEQAVKDATKAGELIDWKIPVALETLAAAYAESGDFSNAVKWQEKALEMSTAADKSQLEHRLNLYKSGKPFRQESKR